jgi:hypothetical protein
MVGLARGASLEIHLLTVYYVAILSLVAKVAVGDLHPQLAVETTQRNQIKPVEVAKLSIEANSPERSEMSASPRPEIKENPAQELQGAATLSPHFDRDLAVKIGECIAVRRKLCGLSRQQLGARLESTRWKLRLTSEARSE